MAESLDNLANRLESDPFFLACPLRLFADSMKLDNEHLAEKLGCSVGTLTPVRLCRAPAGDAAQFQKDILRIADEFKLDAATLVEAVRLGQAIFAMRTGSSSSALMAARDGEKEGEHTGGDVS